MDFDENYEYGHCILQLDSNNLIEFEALPYNPSPYPKQDIELQLYEHTDGKLWAIGEHKGEIHAFFQNPQTNNRVVYQKLKSTTSLIARTNKKEQEGYGFIGNCHFDALNRSFI